MNPLTDSQWAGPSPSVLVVMGVSGCGKSTVARALASKLGWAYADGDDFHSDANVAKMSAGVPLSDDDRWPWLEEIARWIDDRAAAGRPAVIACSALKRSYRDVLRRPGMAFVYLEGSAETISARLNARQGHFMAPELLASQLEALEPPANDEPSVTIRLEREQDPDQIVTEVVAAVGLL